MGGTIIYRVWKVLLKSEFASESLTVNIQKIIITHTATVAWHNQLDVEGVLESQEVLFLVVMSIYQPQKFGS